MFGSAVWPALTRVLVGPQRLLRMQRGGTGFRAGVREHDPLVHLDALGADDGHELGAPRGPEANTLVVINEPGFGRGGEDPGGVGHFQSLRSIGVASMRGEWESSLPGARLTP